MTISLKELSDNIIESHRNDIELPNFEQYIYGQTTSPKYLYVVRKEVPFNLNTQGNWVFNASIDPKDVNRAWQHIAPRLFDAQCGVSSCEVYNVNYQAYKHYVRRGLQLSIHSTPEYQTHQQLYALLRDIETILTAEGIKPGARPKATISVTGSSFFYSRDQIKFPGFRISAREAIKEAPQHPFNPFERNNPYWYFNLNRNSNPFTASATIDETLSELTESSEEITPKPKPKKKSSSPTKR